MNFDEFKQFYKKHPGKSNSFYYRQFPKGNQSTIRNYKYRCKNAKNTVATHDATNNKITKSTQKNTQPSEGLATPPTIILEDIDTIKEMERTIQLIKDPDKRATQLSRLHAMKLKPIVNKNKISLKEMFDSAGS